MSVVEVEAVVATSHPIPAYGGVQLGGGDILEQMADALRRGDLPLMLQHDIRRQLKASVLDAEARDRADGYKEVWVRFEVDAAQWNEFERERVDAGAPGGMSFACGEPVGLLQALGGDVQANFILAADASHWDDATLFDAGEALRAAGAVALQRRYEFSHIPNAVIVLQVAGTLTLGVIANAVYDALKRFIGRNKRTTFHIHVVKDGLDVTAHVETDDPESLRRALDSFDAAVRPGRLFVWDEEQGGWVEE